MTPLARLAASLVVSVVLAWPAFLACLRGATDLESAVLRWSLAFIGARCAFGVIGRIIEAYRTDEQVAAAEPAISDDADDDDRRRMPAS